MRKLGLALAAALLAAPALAADVSQGELPSTQPFTPAPTVQGHADLFAGFGTVFDEDFNYWVFGGGGRVNVPLGDVWNLQIDPQFVGVFDTDDSDSVTDLAGYAHLYRRTPTSAFGFFFGYDHTDYFGLQLDGFGGGVEGQIYWPNTTLYGQAALYRHTPDCCDAVTTASVRGELQHFFGDNTMIAGDLIWTHVDAFNGGDIFSAALSAMHRFDGSHFGIFAQGRYDTYFDNFESVAVVLGVRAFFDPPGSTLKSNLRTGPAMNVQPLPIFWPEGAIALSDVRLKRDIVVLGRLPNGLGLYRYRYLWSDTLFVGVMAQEVAELVPPAVVEGADGYLRVNYARLGLSLMTWDQWLGFQDTAMFGAALGSRPQPSFPFPG